MKPRSFTLAAAMTLIAFLPPGACSSRHTSPPGDVSSAVPTVGAGEAGEPVPGRTITKEVPHSSETVTDIKEREAREPLPARGDVAIPSHRIQRGDNASTQPPPAGAPAEKQVPPGKGSAEAGGRQ